MIGIITGVVFSIVAIGVDVWLYLDTTKETPTWSRVIYDLGVKTPLFAYGWGVLAGHWFPFTTKPMIDETYGWVFLLVWIFTVLAITHAVWRFPVYWVLPIAYVTGSLLWPVEFKPSRFWQ